MADESAPGSPGTAEESPSLDMEQSYNAALEQLGGTGREDDAQPQPAAPAQAGIAPTQAEADHIRWAKQIEGDYDQQTGQFNTDRVVKRAYELNRGYQATAQRLAKVEAALQRPEIRAAIQQALAPPAQQERPQAERTDEEILAEFVERRADALIKARMGPLLNEIMPRVQSYQSERVANHTEATYQNVREDFGKATDGSYLYDEVAPQVGDAMNAVAESQGLTRDQLVSRLVDKGQLAGTIQIIARNLLFDRYRNGQARVSQAASQIERQKRARLSPARGAPSGGVAQQRKVDTVEDAWKAAEEELGLTIS